MRRKLSKLLKAEEPSPDWTVQLKGFATKLRELAARDADLALYYLNYSHGETGIVIARGAKAHTPIVAALRRADGGLLMQPARRDTQLRGYAVVRGITTHEVRVRLHHLRALRC